MGKAEGGSIARELERLLGRGVAPEGDGDLLERFRLRGDEGAFEELVTRHGPMVRGVCRRLLRDDHDADDAFQATFLVLARKGAWLRDPDRLGPWLFGVASRVAAKARASRRRDRPLTEDLPMREDRRAEWSDVLPIVDAELARLPARQRDVLVACLLDGSTEQEAARSLACPVGTVKSRLSRAREALRIRLVRRGIAPAAALAAASSSSEVFASPVPPILIRTTLALVSAKAAIPAAVAALTRGAAPTMLSKSIVAAVALTGSMSLVALSAASWRPEEPAQAQPAPEDRRAPALKGSPTSEVDGKMRLILLALQAYHLAHGAFPTEGIGPPDKPYLLSWRVAILPQLGEDELYAKFRLGEPWDSPHNRALIREMPDVYRTIDPPASPGKTRFRGFIGESTMFDWTVHRDTGRGVTLPSVLDGARNTAMLGLAEDEVEWTRAEGLLLVPTTRMMPHLYDDVLQRCVFGMVDGSVRRIRLSDEPFQWKWPLSAILTRAGGEVVDWSRIPHAAPAVSQTDAVPRRQGEVGGAAEPAPRRTPASKPAEDIVTTLEEAPTGRIMVPQPPKARDGTDAAGAISLEERLRRMEQKLDQVLRRLDAVAPGLPEAKPGPLLPVAPTRY